MLHLRIALLNKLLLCHIRHMYIVCMASFLMSILPRCPWSTKCGTPGVYLFKHKVSFLLKFYNNKKGAVLYHRQETVW